MSASVEKVVVVVKEESDEEEYDSLECLSCQGDVLKPTKKVYEEFDTNFDFPLGKPDYKFQIKDISDLIQCETELMGKEFPLPGCSFTVQTKCDVKYDQFTLSMVFLYPEFDKKPIETRMNTKHVTILKRKNRATNKYVDNTVFSDSIPLQTNRVYGTFFPFLTFYYTKNIKNDQGLDDDCIALHLHVKNCLLSTDMFLEKRVLQWKIDVTSVEKPLGEAVVGGKEFGLTPFLYYDPNGLKIQVRAFVEGNNWTVEVRYLDEKAQYKFLYPVINFNVIHPTDPTRKITKAFKPAASIGKNVLVPMKSAYRFVFVTIDQMLPFVSNDKLMLRVDY